MASMVSTDFSVGNMILMSRPKSPPGRNLTSFHIHVSNILCIVRSYHGLLNHAKVVSERGSQGKFVFFVGDTNKAQMYM